MTRSAQVRAGTTPTGCRRAASRSTRTAPRRATSSTTATRRRQCGTTPWPLAVRIATDASSAASGKSRSRNRHMLVIGPHHREEVERVGQRPGPRLDADPPAVAAEHERDVGGGERDEHDDPGDALALPGPLEPEHERAPCPGAGPTRPARRRRRVGTPVTRPATTGQATALTASATEHDDGAGPLPARAGATPAARSSRQRTTRWIRAAAPSAGAMPRVKPSGRATSATSR